MSEDLIVEKWFDFDLQAPSGAPFDERMMAAMNWPWPITIFPQQKVVASGMTPPDNLPK